MPEEQECRSRLKGGVPISRKRRRVRHEHYDRRDRPGKERPQCAWRGCAWQGRAKEDRHARQTEMEAILVMQYFNLSPGARNVSPLTVGSQAVPTNFHSSPPSQTTVRKFARNMNCRP